MNFRNLMMFTAVATILFGAGFLLAPAQLGSLFAISTTPTSIFALRLYATSLLGIGLLAWLVRPSQDRDLHRPVLLSFFVTDFGGFLVLLFAQLAGLMNALGWFVVVLLLLFSAAFAYLRFAGPAP